MPTLSLYAFDRDGAEQAGPFWQSHISYADGGWAWDSISNLGSTHSVLAWDRPGGEMVLDLSAAANNPLALSTIDGLLTSPASRSGPVRTSYVTWSNVPGVVHDPNPTLHQPWELLITMMIDFHVHTPWFCTDADGTITFYIYPFLDGGGNLRATVDGMAFHFGGGFPVCSGDIHDALQNSGGAAIGALQNLLNTALPLFAGGHTFWMLYILPGHGDNSGFSSDDADNNAALAVLPN
jgi:hypothetical protein